MKTTVSIFPFFNISQLQNYPGISPVAPVIDAFFPFFRLLNSTENSDRGLDYQQYGSHNK